MTELRVVAEIVAKPGSEDGIRAALSTLAVATRDEAGCLAYEVFESDAAAGTFFTIETWRSPEDMAAHLQTEHLAAAFAAADGHVSVPPAIHPLNPVG